MAGNQIATAYVQVMPSMQGIQGKLEEGFGAEGGKAGSAFGSKLVKAVTGILSVAGIGKALSATLMEGADLQQNLGGVEAVFGEFASGITASAQEAYSQMGLSASDYMATANKMGSLFQGSGLEQQRSLELTAQAMQRAADVASVMGIDMSMAMESIAGAAKGNFTMMDNLGVAMNAVTLQAYALEEGVNFKWETASNAEKTELAMKMFFDRTSQYAGNFERESKETFTGAMESMKASAKNVLGNLMLGNDMQPSLNALAETTVTFLKGNLMPAVLNILKALPASAAVLLKGLMPSNIKNVISSMILGVSARLKAQGPELLRSGTQMVLSLLAGFQAGQSGFLQDVSILLGSLMTSFYAVLPSVMDSGCQINLQLITGLLSGIPSLLDAVGTLLQTLLTSVMSAAPSLLSSGASLILSLAGGLIASLPHIISSAVQLVTNLLSTFAGYLPDLLAQGISLIGQLVAGLVSMIPDVIAAAGDIAGDMLDTIKEVDWLDLGKSIIDGIIGGIKNAAASLYNALRELAKKALEKAKEALGIHSPSRLFRDQVGRFIPEGVAAGITGNLSVVDNAMDKLTTSARSRFTAALQVEARGVVPPGGGDGSPGRGVSVVQHIYSQTHTAAELMQEARYQAEMAVLFGV